MFQITGRQPHIGEKCLRFFLQEFSVSRICQNCARWECVRHKWVLSPYIRTHPLITSTWSKVPGIWGWQEDPSRRCLYCQERTDSTKVTWFKVVRCCTYTMFFWMPTSCEPWHLTILSGQVLRWISKGATFLKATSWWYLKSRIWNIWVSDHASLFPLRSS